MIQAGILKSGYLSYDPKELTFSSLDDSMRRGSDEARIKILTVVGGVPNVLSTRDKESFFFNMKLNELGQRWLSGEHILREFDDRETLYRQFKKSLGTESFYDWLTIQVESPYVTSSHIFFLKETVEFIFKGYRATNPMYYLDIFTRDFGYSTLPLQEKRVFLHYIKRMFDEQGQRTSYNVDVVISKWLSTSQGIGDLMNFAYIVFGRK